MKKSNFLYNKKYITDPVHVVFLDVRFGLEVQNMLIGKKKKKKAAHSSLLTWKMFSDFVVILKM